MNTPIFFAYKLSGSKSEFLEALSNISTYQGASSRSHCHFLSICYLPPKVSIVTCNTLCHILSPCLFNLYGEYIKINVGLDKAQVGIKIARRNINNLKNTDDTTLMAESGGGGTKEPLDE